MLVRLFPTVFNWGHPKASHFPKWTVLVGKWVVLKRKMGSAENWACPKNSTFIILTIYKTNSRN